MLGDAKVDEHGNITDMKDYTSMCLDKDGEDSEINILSAICFLRGKAYEALENRAQARLWYKAAIKADPLCYGDVVLSNSCHLFCWPLMEKPLRLKQLMGLSPVISGSIRRDRRPVQTALLLFLHGHKDWGIVPHLMITKHCQNS